MKPNGELVDMTTLMYGTKAHSFHLDLLKSKALQPAVKVNAIIQTIHSNVIINFDSQMLS